jgi:hypothetical protein
MWSAKRAAGARNDSIVTSRPSSATRPSHLTAARSYSPVFVTENEADPQGVVERHVRQLAGRGDHQRLVAGCEGSAESGRCVCTARHGRTYVRTLVSAVRSGSRPFSSAHLDKTTLNWPNPSPRRRLRRILGDDGAARHGPPRAMIGAIRRARASRPTCGRKASWGIATGIAASSTSVRAGTSGRTPAEQDHDGVA